MSVPSPDLARLLQAADQAMRRGDLAAAKQLAAQAATIGEVRPQVLVLAVFDRVDRGDAAAALGFAERAMAMSRHDAEVLNAYGVALDYCGRYKDALKAFDSALRQAPTRAGIHYNRACVLDRMGNNTQARMAFERTVALQANHAQALGRLAFLEMQRGNNGAAREYGSRALRLQPNEPSALLAVASADVQEKAYADALTRVRPLLGGTASINVAIAQGLAADAFDGLKRRDEAFRAYAACNDILYRLHRGSFEVPGQDGARQSAERLAAYFQSAPADSWRGGTTDAPARIHAFLVGFPRSGTTLLEQALAAHPDVETMDERLCLQDMTKEFLGDGAGIDRLATLSEEALEPWRKRYWQRVGEYGVQPTKSVFIDKLPLNLVVLPLVAKLFSQAKILFAIRDPIDVVWSCFRRRFGMNAQMFELLSLDGAARYYDTVMRLGEIYRDRLGLAMHDTVYERTVADFEGEMRKVCAFLGIPWDAAMADFSTSARARAPNTPSAPQLAKGLYSHAVGQWKAYREQLAPIVPMLAPWRRRFGYDEE